MFRKKTPDSIWTEQSRALVAGLMGRSLQQVWYLVPAVFEGAPCTWAQTNWQGVEEVDQAVGLRFDGDQWLWLWWDWPAQVDEYQDYCIRLSETWPEHGAVVCVSADRSWQLKLGTRLSGASLYFDMCEDSIIDTSKPSKTWGLIDIALRFERSPPVAIGSRQLRENGPSSVNSDSLLVVHDEQQWQPLGIGPYCSSKPWHTVDL